MFDKVNILCKYQEDSRCLNRDITETLTSIFKCVQLIKYTASIFKFHEFRVLSITLCLKVQPGCLHLQCKVILRRKYRVYFRNET